MDNSRNHQRILLELIRSEEIKGPLSILKAIAMNRQRVHIKCHQGRHIIATLMAFDNHFNMLLIDAKIRYKIRKRDHTGKRAVVVAKRFYNKILLRGENVIFARAVPNDVWESFAVKM